MSREDYRQRTDGRSPSAPTAGHYCARIRRFTEEHATRILRSHARTDARNWATIICRSRRRRRGDRFGHGLRGTIATMTPLKGTDATAPRHVRGTLRGQP
jgi:hypothetical protein